MIIRPFEVAVGQRKYTFIDRESIDSRAAFEVVHNAIIAQLMASQRDAMCDALGLGESDPEGKIPNFGFGVYDERDTFVGAYLMASNEHVGGLDPIMARGRHMPAFGPLGTDEERLLSVETCHRFLVDGLPLIDGRSIQYTRISWAIFEYRSDPGTLRDVGVHTAIVSDSRLQAYIEPDDDDPALSRVDLELR